MSEPRVERYTPENIKEAVLSDVDRLIRPWMVGRPETYTIDASTTHTIATGYWLREELAKVALNDDDRRTQEWKFNRLSRTYDVWEIAAEVMNDVIDGVIEQDRRCHRRWG